MKTNASRAVDFRDSECEVILTPSVSYLEHSLYLLLLL